MKEVDYNKLGNLTLEESGFLSSDSTQLKEFIHSLGITKVSDFLKYIDSISYAAFPYKEILMEIQGLADILKQKYFGIPFDNNINFADSIKYMLFDEISTPVRLFGVKTINRRQLNIYSLIIRLGFNTKERDKILDVTEKFLDGVILIDLLYDAYNRIIINVDDVDNDRVLINKLLVILNYYLINYKEDRQSNFMKDFYDGINEFNDVLVGINLSASEGSKKNK